MRRRNHVLPRVRVAVMRIRETRWLLAGAGLALIAILLSACGATALPADIEISLYQGGDVLGSNTVTLSDLLDDGKPMVLNMWAGLCSACRLEMPHLENVYQEYANEVLILGLDIGPFVGLGDREDALALLDELDVTYPAGATDNIDVVKAYQVVGTPSLFFITPDGEIVKRWAGMMAEDDLKESIEELLAASGN